MHMLLASSQVNVTSVLCSYDAQLQLRLAAKVHRTLAAQCRSSSVNSLLGPRSSLPPMVSGTDSFILLARANGLRLDVSCSIVATSLMVCIHCLAEYRHDKPCLRAQAAYAPNAHHADTCQLLLHGHAFLPMPKPMQARM